MFQDSYYDNKPNRRGCNLPNSNEDWQFENPLLVVSKDGDVIKNKMGQRASTYAKPPKMRSIREFLDKEVDEVEFLKLQMEKQIKIVADEYKAGTKIHKIEDKLGVSKHVIYDRIDKAKAIGLITEMRGQGNMPQQVIVQEAPELPKATVEDFTTRAERKLELAERLAKEAELLQQAGHIALALTELLGDKADPIVSQLYTEVSA